MTITVGGAGRHNRSDLYLYEPSRRDLARRVARHHAPDVTTTTLEIAGRADAAGARRVPTKVILSLGLVYSIWSSTYLALRWVVVALPPLLSAGARYCVAGAILYAVCRLRGARPPSRREWAEAVAPGVLLFACGNGFVALAERDVPSGVAAVACAAMPLLLALLETLAGARPSWRDGVGLGIGFLGVLVLGAGDLRRASFSGAILLLAPVGWALGTWLTRRRALARGALGASTQMITGGLGCLALGGLRGEPLPSSVPLTAIAALVYLVVAGSLVAFSAYTYLLSATRPAIATSYAYVNPILAVGLGVLLGGEHLGATALSAAALVVLGVAVMATGRARSTPGGATR
jgi:drug/metabolite transporter (DMT)-like permease